jgi:hypothetical protein
VGAVKSLALLRHNVPKTHSQLMEMAHRLFIYASDESGVRHAKTNSADAVEFAEAKLAIVTASALVNFIVEKAP